MTDRTRWGESERVTCKYGTAIERQKKFISLPRGMVAQPRALKNRRGREALSTAQEKNLPQNPETKKKQRCGQKNQNPYLNHMFKCPKKPETSA
jgi:hypothetical protein